MTLDVTCLAALCVGWLSGLGGGGEFSALTPILAALCGGGEVLRLTLRYFESCIYFVRRTSCIILFIVDL